MERYPATGGVRRGRATWTEKGTLGWDARSSGRIGALPMAIMGEKSIYSFWPFAHINTFRRKGCRSGVHQDADFIILFADNATVIVYFIIMCFAHTAALTTETLDYNINLIVFFP